MGAGARRALVLAYHNVVPDDAFPVEGDASLHVPRRLFARQLELLCEHLDVVPLADLLEREPGGRPRAAITFDDAYAGALTLGLDTIRAYRLPVTFFVAPGLLGSPSFWWDDLARALGPRARAAREAVLREARGLDGEVRAWMARRGIPSVPPSDVLRPATEEELLRAAQRDGVSVAAHSWSHPNLTQLDDAGLREELFRPREWLAARFSGTLPVLAYPYGLSDPRVRGEAGRAGYRAAFRVDGGWIPGRGAEPHALPRLGVAAGLSLDGFRLRLAGWLAR
jgi:peptidoglycan/xylan/chitin deacetylase (PgdA/CDA1 family)